MAIVTAAVLRIPFGFWADQFSSGRTNRQSAIIAIRGAIRRLVFTRALAVCTCGKPGLESAKLIGCPEAKLINFPYAVDQARLRCPGGTSSIVQNIKARALTRPIVLYSGRMIQRKGADVLLRALGQLIKTEEFFAVFEGEGPLREEFEVIALEFGLGKSCVFVGFRQMSEHAALLGVADVVIIPSQSDPWGIVVHEAMLLSKCVCASSGVGCAQDRIQDGKNGFLFPPNDHKSLAHLLARVLRNGDLRRTVGLSAGEVAREWSPQRNVEAFLEVLEANALL